MGEGFGGGLAPFPLWPEVPLDWLPCLLWLWLPAWMPLAGEVAFFPLVTHTPNPSPLLPYILHILPGEGASAPRAIAVARLKHAPRDTIGLVAEKSASGWTLVDVVAVVDQ